MTPTKPVTMVGSSVTAIHRCLVLIFGAFLAIQATTVSVHCQVVTGQVVDSTSGMGVGAGFVVLLDSLGNEVGRTLSDRDGHFRLAVVGAGTYRLRSERIGYRSNMSRAIEVRSNESIDYDLHVAAIPIVLSAVTVPGEDRCRVNPDGAAETALIWEEIRKALAATAWDSTQELALYRKYGYERELTSDRREVISEEGRTLEGVAGQPYQSLPATLLARDGYVVTREDGTIWYNLPDAAVLLDDTFLSTHCFRVVRDDVTKPGQLGLAFEPVVDRGVPDVRGALWLDELSSRLISLEVEYTNLPDAARAPGAGGTVEFMQLPSGAWIVKRWNIRTPNIHRSQATEERVTIVIIARRGAITPLATERRRLSVRRQERSSPWGATRLEAVYAGGRRIQLDRLETVRRGDSLAVVLPWEASGIAFRTEYGVSETVYLQPGDVYVIRYPEYFRPGGLLYKP